MEKLEQWLIVKRRSNAETHRDRDVKIAITNKIEVSIAAAFKDESIGKAEAKEIPCKTQANAIACKGENEARIAIAQSEATS
jgi:flotillin